MAEKFTFWSRALPQTLKSQVNFTSAHEALSENKEFGMGGER